MALGAIVCPLSCPLIIRESREDKLGPSGGLTQQYHLFSPFQTIQKRVKLSEEMQCICAVVSLVSSIDSPFRY